ncbi:NAD(P)H-dependent oxidoreductase [Streptomyces sp. NPDC001709]
MATLLHIDSSVFPGEAFSSRAVTAAFRATWEEQHPEGTVIYRNLAADSVPHITADAWSAGYAAPAERTPEQPAALAARVKFIEELEEADASRGGSYAPGTPREGYEFVQNYLEAVLKRSLGLDLDFIVPELTTAPRNPAMSELVPLYEASRNRAFEDATAKAKELVERLAE